LSILYYINLFLALPILIWTTRIINHRFRLSLFSLPNFLFATTLPVVFAKRLSPYWLGELEIDNRYFAFAILMDNVSYFIMMVETSLLCKHFDKISRISEKLFDQAFAFLKYSSNTNNQLDFCYYISLIFYILTFLALATTNSDVLTWILNPRYGYQYSREAAGHWYALSIIFLGINSVTLFLYRLKNAGAFIILSLIYTYLWYLYGGKAYIIAFCALLLFCIQIRFGKLFRAVFFVSSILFAAIIVLALFFSDLTGLEIDLAFDSIGRYFDHYKYATMYFEDYFNSKIQLFEGEINLTKIYKYIPRALFPDKPYVYGAILVNEIYLPGMAAKGHTPEFSGQVQYFADFGIIGVFFFNIFDFQFIFRHLSLFVALKAQNNSRNLKTWYLLFAATYSMAPAFSQFVTFPFDALVLVVFGIAVVFFSKIFSLR
jgi:hypothetical protein